jgi:hypothetical protein
MNTHISTNGSDSVCLVANMHAVVRLSPPAFFLQSSQRSRIFIRSEGDRAPAFCVWPGTYIHRQSRYTHTDIKNKCRRYTYPTNTVSAPHMWYPRAFGEHVGSWPGSCSDGYSLARGAARTTPANLPKTQLYIFGGFEAPTNWQGSGNSFVTLCKFTFNVNTSCMHVLVYWLVRPSFAAPCAFVAGPLAHHAGAESAYLCICTEQASSVHTQSSKYTRNDMYAYIIEIQIAAYAASTIHNTYGPMTGMIRVSVDRPTLGKPPPCRRALRALPPKGVRKLECVAGIRWGLCYTRWHIIDNECGPKLTCVSACELGFLCNGRVGGPTGGNGSKGTGGGHTCQLRLYVEWAGSGKDVGAFWVVCHACVESVVNSMDLLLFEGVRLGLCLACATQGLNVVAAWELGSLTSSSPVLHLILTSLWCGKGYGRGWSILLGLLYTFRCHFRSVCVGGLFTIPCCKLVSATAAFTVCPSTGICRAALVARCILNPIFPSEAAPVNVDWTGDVCSVCHTAMQRCSCPRNGQGRGVARAGGQHQMNGQGGASSSAAGGGRVGTPRRAWSRDILRPVGSDPGAVAQGASHGVSVDDAPMGGSPASAHLGGAAQGNAVDRGSGRRDRSRDRERPGRQGGRTGRQGLGGMNLMSSFENMRVGERLEHCPVVGCCVSAGRGHPGLGKAALKNHIDSHLLGITQGQVPAQWMNDKGWCVSVLQSLGGR